MEQLRFPRVAEEASAECRHAWIEDRIFQLADSFAVSVYAYAVMSNHFHIVLRSDPATVWQWTDREAAERWLAIFPGSISNRDDPACVERATLALLGNAERLDVIRQRLGSISWFMRALNEPIARLANREDGCTRGRAIASRFFRFAKTATVALPTLGDSGKVGSSVRRCWTNKLCFLAWPTLT